MQPGVSNGEYTQAENDAHCWTADRGERHLKDKVSLTSWARLESLSATYSPAV